MTPRPETQKRGSRLPPRPQGPPPVTHLELRAATAKQVQQLCFVQFEDWFSSRRDERASEHFYIPLQEDFYNAYLNNGVASRSQRVCSIEALVAAAGEQIHPHLSYLSRLIDLLRRTGRYIPSWVCEFYSSLWIDPGHRFIYFAFRGRDYMLQSSRVKEILRIPESPIRIHEVCYG